MLQDDCTNGRPHEADCQADRPRDGPRGRNAARLHALVMTYHKPEAWRLSVSATGGVPETPKDPPRNFQRVRVHHRTGSGVCFQWFKPWRRTASAKPGQSRHGGFKPPPQFPQPRSSQAVRQRSHTPHIAGSNPASATILKHRARGSQQTRLAWDEETPGAAPGRATIFR
jgi:hypothetical protein